MARGFGQPRPKRMDKPREVTKAELLVVATAARRWITLRRAMARRLEDLGRPTDAILSDVKLSLIADTVGERDLDEALTAVGL
jgi:hypothetical protein